MMDEGEPQAADSSVSAVQARLRADALARLRYGWGEAYRIGWTIRRGWWARRRDNVGEEITAPDDAALWDAIRLDYDSNPVTRDPLPGQRSLR